MKISSADQKGLNENMISLLQRIVKLVPWPERRRAKSDIVETLLDGQVRAGEDLFGWSRQSISIGMEERQSGLAPADNIEKRRKRTTEEKLPNITQDIHKLFDAKSQADCRLGTTLRYLNASAANVRSALLANGYAEEELPTVRTISNLLDRMEFRLRSVQKAKPQKKRRRRT